MRTACIVSILLVASLAAGQEPPKPAERAPAATETCRVAGSTVTFLDGDAARRILGGEDGFVLAQSPFDRAARLKTDKEVDRKTYLEFVADQVRPWSAGERRDVDAAWCKIAQLVEARRWKLALPRSVLLIKTSGHEEGQTPYTRGDAIILPEGALATPRGAAMALPHELFHVMSRTLARVDPARQNALYALVGYVPLDGEVDIPAELRALAITNPDSYAIRHAVKIKHDGAPLMAVPFLFASSPRYDVARGGEFFGYLQFKLLPIHRVGKVWRVDRDKEGHAVLLDAKQTSYSDVVGRNTDENFQADEVLAGNFPIALGWYGSPSIPDAWVVERLDRALQQP